MWFSHFQDHVEISPADFFRWTVASGKYSQPGIAIRGKDATALFKKLNKRDVYQQELKRRGSKAIRSDANSKNAALRLILHGGNNKV